MFFALYDARKVRALVEIPGKSQKLVQQLPARVGS
jgi:hypothetical protein